MVKALCFASYSVWSVDGAIVQMELFLTSGNEDDRTTQSESESIKRQRLSGGNPLRAWKGPHDLTIKRQAV